MRRRGWTQRRLRRLGVPPPTPPFHLQAWCEAIAANRGRPVVVESVPVGSTGPAGLWMAMSDVDYIAVDAGASRALFGHVILHELAHLLLGHQGAASSATVRRRTLRHLLGHSTDIVTDGREHREAEAVAEIMAHWLEQSSRHPHDSSPQWTQVLGISAVARWMRWRSLYWRLHPLWLALYRVSPHICLRPSACPELDDTLPIWGAYRALYRRVVEIHQGLYWLRRYTSDAVGDRARDRARRADLHGWRADAVGDAAMLMVALQEASGGPPPAGSARTGGRPRRYDDRFDLEAEAMRLVRICRAMSCPLVAAEVAIGGRRGDAAWSPRLA